MRLLWAVKENILLLADVFDGLAKKHGAGECVGVLVSGSESIQEDIARECKRHSSWLSSPLPFSGSIKAATSTNDKAIFHYHSVSFSL